MLSNEFSAVSLLSSLLWSPVLPSHAYEHTHHSSNSSAEYDYIIIGSGAGGDPLAACLARGGHNVLLLDPGDDQHALQQQIPAMQLHSTDYELMLWDYFVNHYEDLSRQKEDSKIVYRTPTCELYRGPNPSDNSELLGILYPCVGTLGGSTAHNAMHQTSLTQLTLGVDYLQGKSLYCADPRSRSASSGTPGQAHASKEVILAAGTFNTPQLLKLSEIGAKSELAMHNIERSSTSRHFVLTANCTFIEELPGSCYEDWKNDVGFKGAYVTNGIAIAIIKKPSVAEHDEPDLLISGAPGNFIGSYPGFPQECLQDAQHWAWIMLKSLSRNNAGTVELRSTDPRDTPVINFHSFDESVTAHGADENDLQAVYEAVEFSREIFDSLVPLDGDFSETWPGRDNVTNEKEMKDFIKNEAWGHHACCTAPIGKDGDDMAVLDGDFRVRGVDGLRVVDASVFPKIPGYYVALPIYMISEKAADIILADAGKR